jgi:6-pyruvoyltetrahydropterin/6-carboxytetrahydropterin synthase
MYSICKEFSFDAAHRLYNLSYASKCQNIHGHRYHITVELFVGNLNKDSMVIDFTHFKIFSDWIDNFVDHSMLIACDDNELLEMCKKINTRYIVIPYEKTTSENLAKFFFEEIKILYGNLCKEIKITVHETPKNYASYTGKSK